MGEDVLQSIWVSSYSLAYILILLLCPTTSCMHLESLVIIGHHFHPLSSVYATPLSALQLPFVVPGSFLSVFCIASWPPSLQRLASSTTICQRFPSHLLVKTKRSQPPVPIRARRAEQHSLSSYQVLRMTEQASCFSASILFFLLL